MVRPVFVGTLPEGDGPAYEALYRKLQSAILGGKLLAGDRLPATRDLSRELGVSRNTVLAAYDLLVQAGFAEARVGAGTFVRRRTQRAPVESTGAELAPNLSDFGRRLADGTIRYPYGDAEQRLPLPYELIPGIPDVSLFPRAVFSRLLSRRMRAGPLRQLVYGPPAGDRALREAIADYLAQSRGVRATPERVVVTSGSQQGLDLITRVLVDTGDGVVMEEPGYPGATNALLARNARMHFVRADEEGLCTDELPDSACALCFVTPSHQFPLGGVLPVSRRLDLLAWAEKHRAVVVEDDYDGEFRYSSRPLDALQSVDNNGRVIYSGTFSKTLAPALRLGFLVVPDALVDVMTSAKWLADWSTPTAMQQALADFITDGHLERHLKRCRKEYSARREALVSALERHLGTSARVAGDSAGLHVVLWFDTISAARTPEVLERARAQRVGVYSVNELYRTPPPRLGLLLGYGLVDRAGAIEAARRLARALEPFL